MSLRSIQLIRRGLAGALLALAACSFAAAQEPVSSVPAPDPVAADPIATALDREIERAQAHAATLDDYSKRLDAAAAASRTAVERVLAHCTKLSAQLRIRPRGAEAIGGLYDEIVAELLRARPELAAALDKQPDPPPRFVAGFEPRGIAVPALADRVRRLENLIENLDGRRASLAELESAARGQAIDGWGDATHQLNVLRLEAIDLLPEPRRKRVLGVSREGVAQLVREIQQLGLSAHLYQVRRLNQVDALPARLLDVFTVGSATWKLLKALIAILLFVFLRRRLRGIGSGAYRFVRQAFIGAAAQRRGEWAVRTLQVVAPWGLFLLTLAALRWSLGNWTAYAELDLPLRIATLYGAYRLSIDLIYAVTLQIVRRYRLSLEGGRAEQLLRSVRTLMRVVVGILVVLMLSEQLVGRGYLYHRVVRFSWIFVLAALLLLLGRWRGPIADAYLALHDSGRLAGAVHRSRDRWYGVFLAAAAFVLLAGRAAVRVGRDFVLGFDQTRRALAFVFRRSIEKRAEQRGYADGDVSALPAALVRALEERPVTESDTAVPHFPGLERLQATIGRWREADAGASFLLSGENGMGKTSWLNSIDPLGLPLKRVKFTHRVSGEATLAASLIKALELPLEPDAGLSALGKALASGSKMIVTVDLAQNLFVGKVGGFDTFESFATLVESTCDRVLWVCAISAFAWDHLLAVRPDLNVFRDREALAAWSEEEIGRMLSERTALGGARVVYDDLLPELRGVPDESRIAEAQKQYTRLLWDYSDGNPKVALHFWLRSLVPVEGQPLRVRLFRAPAPSELDALGERMRFLLAAIVGHENLSLNEAADVTRYPRAVCRLMLQRLHDEGILRRNQRRYRLSTHWHRAVVRFLKRGNLLSD